MLPPGLNQLLAQLTEFERIDTVVNMQPAATSVLQELRFLDADAGAVELFKRMNPLPPPPTGGQSKCKICGCDLTK